MDVEESGGAVNEPKKQIMWTACASSLSSGFLSYGPTPTRLSVGDFVYTND